MSSSQRREGGAGLGPRSSDRRNPANREAAHYGFAWQRRRLRGRRTTAIRSA